ncbi:MAG: neutral zinc metallopeptidase, partial [Chloroflexota bacterium]|nr:neutral zinc metallopeptidase [Chloroflexota bacterium]
MPRLLARALVLVASALALLSGLGPAGVASQAWLEPALPPTAVAPWGFGGNAGFGGDLNAASQELDRFWSGAFADAGAPYRPPAAIVALDRRLTTGCGPASPLDADFFYCPADETIYLAPIALEAVAALHGDYGAITILAHEWGHHVQWLLGVPPDASNGLDLQADCLAGAWTRRAGELGLLDPGDITEAAKLSAEAGDDYGAPQDVPGAHGIDDDRITAFVRGYDDGLGDCAL